VAATVAAKQQQQPPQHIDAVEFLGERFLQTFKLFVVQYEM